jgi:hypothetical protein
VLLIRQEGEPGHYAWASACGIRRVVDRVKTISLLNVGENYRTKLKVKPEDTFQAVTNSELKVVGTDARLVLASLIRRSID